MSKTFPELSRSVRGDTDILTGIKYIKCIPQANSHVPYRSAFSNSGGSDRVVAGPHPEFTKAEESEKGPHAGKSVYYCPTTEQYWNRCRIEGKVSLLGNKPK